MFTCERKTTKTCLTMYPFISKSTCGSWSSNLFPCKSCHTFFPFYPFLLQFFSIFNISTRRVMEYSSFRSLRNSSRIRSLEIHYCSIFFINNLTTFHIILFCSFISGDFIMFFYWLNKLVTLIAIIFSFSWSCDYMNIFGF